MKTVILHLESERYEALRAAEFIAGKGHRIISIHDCSNYQCYNIWVEIEERFVGEKEDIKMEISEHMND